MTENLETAPRRVSRRQLLTVGVLALIFVGVLIAQFGTAGATTVFHAAPGETPGTSGRPTAPTSQPRADSRRKTSQAALPWRDCALTKVVEFDPFAQPSSLALSADPGQPNRTGDSRAAEKSEKSDQKSDQNNGERERALTALRQGGVKLVVGTTKGFVAVVGSKTVHVGDELNGFRVREIKPDGIVLEDK